MAKNYVNLAKEHGKSKWAYGLLGIVIYLLGSILAGILIGGFYLLVLEKEIGSLDDFVLNLISLPIAVLFWYSILVFLRKRLENRNQLNDEDILDDSFLS